MKGDLIQNCTVTIKQKLGHKYLHHSFLQYASTLFMNSIYAYFKCKFLFPIYIKHKYTTTQTAFCVKLYKCFSGTQKYSTHIGRISRVTPITRILM